MQYKSWKTKLTWVCNFSLPCFLVEFFLLLGYIQSAKRSCPIPFLGSFNYSLNDGSTTFCGSTSVWDVCIDQTEIVVNYTLCPKQQFYSGRFFLLDLISYISNQLYLMYNKTKLIPSPKISSVPIFVLIITRGVKRCSFKSVKIVQRFLLENDSLR